MPPRTEGQFLSDIKEAIDRIETYTADGEEAFLGSHLIQDAVIRQLGIIGEAATHLSEATKGRAPGVPWRQVIATRNFLIHSYASVDLAVVWDTVQGLDTLSQAIRSLSSGS